MADKSSCSFAAHVSWRHLFEIRHCTVHRRIRPNIPRKNRKYFCDNNLALSFGSRVQFSSDGFSKLELPKKKRNTSVTKISYDWCTLVSLACLAFTWFVSCCVLWRSAIAWQINLNQIEQESYQGRPRDSDCKIREFYFLSHPRTTTPLR